MGFKHSWNGTVLTITSDSGTSSADLKGAKGDDGARGPQGAPGDSSTSGGSDILIDDTLTTEGQAADAKATGQKIAEVSTRLDSLTAADVGALPASTTIPSIAGLAKTTEVEAAISALHKVYFSSTEPSGWKNGDIWLKPLD